MNKGSLMRLLDVALALALFQVLKDLDMPYPRTLGGLWGMHRDVFRTATSAVWLVMLWLSLYPSRDRAERVSRLTVTSGALLCVFILAMTYANALVVYSYKALLSQLIYGGTAMLSGASAWALCRGLAKDNQAVPECGDACRVCGRSLAVALGLMLAGMIVCVLKYRQAMWYSVAAADIWLAVRWATGGGRGKF
jgi:hypothetical protein